MCLVMKQWACGAGMKKLSVIRNHYHHFRWNVGAGLRKFRTQLRADKRGGISNFETPDNQEGRCYCNHPTNPRTSVARHILLQPFVQALGESLGGSNILSSP